MSREYKVTAVFILSAIAIVALCATSCSTEAPWETKKVELKMNIKTVSAGFIECSFSTNKNAYYLIAIQPAKKGEDPMKHQKQFMMLALDSANLEYIAWRNDLLKSGEMNVAPFASHALQYGDVTHFFTGLQSETEYWLYAFVVNPDKMQSAGKLYLANVKTTEQSVVDVYFEYRVKGYWDYIYPVDSLGNIHSQFPYLTLTEDSQYIADEVHSTPEEFFTDYFLDAMKKNESDMIRYGVNVDLHDGRLGDLFFKEGHTYYTAIVGFDGFIGNNVIYKFKWTDEDFEAYFKNEDSIVDYGEDD